MYMCIRVQRAHRRTGREVVALGVVELLSRSGALDLWGHVLNRPAFGAARGEREAKAGGAHVDRSTEIDQFDRLAKRSGNHDVVGLDVACMQRAPTC